VAKIVATAASLRDVMSGPREMIDADHRVALRPNADSPQRNKRSSSPPLLE
jgi:hypothetical protein